MFRVTKEQDRYYVKFTGKKNQFNDFINVVYSLPYEDRKIDPKDRRYSFTEKGYRRLLYKFNDILPSIEEFIPEKDKLALSNTDVNVPDICTDFKLTLFNYQKKVIRRALKEQAALIQLPCGTGKVRLQDITAIHISPR